MSCNTEPYNIDNMNNLQTYFSLNKDVTDIDYNTWLSCLNKKMFSDENENILNTYKLIYDNNELSKEINNYSNYIYNTDLMYTYFKIFLFIILGIVYLYFFKITGIPITNLVNVVKEKINELPNIKKNIENKIKPTQNK